MVATRTDAMNKKVLVALVLICGMAPQAALAEKKNSKSGSQLFRQYCSKCHLGGGNIVKEAKPVSGSKELASFATFKAYLSNPPGHMPYYQNLVSDPKLLQSIYDYCKHLKGKPSKA